MARRAYVIRDSCSLQDSSQSTTDSSASTKHPLCSRCYECRSLPFGNGSTSKPPHCVIMLRAAASSQFTRTRPLALGIVGISSTAAAAAAAAAAAGAYYTTTNSDDSTLGPRRQAQFWSRLVPVIADYYWHFGKNSPYVQYQRYVNDDDYRKRRSQLLQELHEKHAPTLLQCMLELKGLYVKLGQVLSVTALPIPEAYRDRFRTLQSDVPGYQDLEIVRQVLKEENVDTAFSYIDPIPCGAASIGQAHCAVLKDTCEQVIIKVQYPDAAWQVPADIRCVGDLLRICVWAGAVDESAAQFSFREFSRQFLSELDYTTEQRNLQETYESSLDPSSPYQRRGVVVPQVYPELSTNKVITMSYLRGPKLEEEARRQLESLGIDVKRGIGSIVREAAAREAQDLDEDTIASEATLAPKTSWKVKLWKRLGHSVGVDNLLWLVRQRRWVVLWSTAAVATMIGWAAPVLPESWNEWSKSHITAYQQVQRLALTQSWIDALFDVHGYQIFQAGLFNSDCHPGNILVIEEDDGSPATRLGLIDYGQCKRLTSEEQVKIAKLVLSVANNESDEQVAAAFRNLGVKTKNDSTEFLAEMARLMLGSFQTQHLDHAYHKKLHSMDRIAYFPKELSMVYRTSLLLRGLAVSLQVNPSVSEQWRSHAQAAVDQHSSRALLTQEESHVACHDSVRNLQVQSELVTSGSALVTSS